MGLIGQSLLRLSAGSFRSSLETVSTPSLHPAVGSGRDRLIAETREYRG